jgi:hypothetical protein
LTIPEPGVLKNDTDSIGFAMFARLLAGPVDGSLTLNPDGSFVYTPSAAFIGEDTFTYQAVDSADGLGSNPATVTVSVLPAGGGGGGCVACPPNPGQTPELDSIMLFGTGLMGLAGYVLRRGRVRRPR